MRGREYVRVRGDGKRNLKKKVCKIRRYVGSVLRRRQRKICKVGWRGHGIEEIRLVSRFRDDKEEIKYRKTDL